MSNVEECSALHCEDEHEGPQQGPARERLEAMLRELVETYHRGHCDRSPWSLCSREHCRDVAIALGLRQ